MSAKPNVNSEEYISLHFKQLIGKIFRPFEDTSILSLALDVSFKEYNENLIHELEESFYIKKCMLNESPLQKLEKI